MPPQSQKIGHLPSDASAILRERYLAGTFSVVTQWQKADITDGTYSSHDQVTDVFDGMGNTLYS